VVLLGALLWGGRRLEDQLFYFPVRMLERLDELEVSHLGQQSWADLQYWQELEERVRLPQDPRS
jgi:hypothetical protein